MIDTHCHIHDDEFDFDFAATVEKSVSMGVNKLVLIGTDAQSSKQAKEKSDHKNTFPTVGLHPHDANQLSDQSKHLEELVDEKTVAIGECGLDYFYMNSAKKIQEEAFRWQIELALQNKIPLVLHIRGSKSAGNDAFDDALRILSDYSGLEAVVHSFYLDVELAKKLQNKGFYIGLNGIVTFSKDAHVKEMIEAVDINKVVLETDAPFLSPTPYRGKTNQPYYIFKTAEYIAKIRNVKPNIINEITTKNAERLFNI